MNEYVTVLKKYAVFEGRAARKEFWMFALVNFIIVLVLYAIPMIADMPWLFALYGIYVLAVFIPGISVTVRRLHDTDRSGWWWWISLVPLVGGIILLVFMILESTPGENRFGANPKDGNGGGAATQPNVAESEGEEAQSSAPVQSSEESQASQEDGFYDNER